MSTITKINKELGFNFGIRTQYETPDTQFDFSKQSGIDCSKDPGPTRQEFKDEADINVLLSKFGVNQQSRPLQFGEQDFTMDLQQAIIAVDESRNAYTRLSPDIQEAFPSWQKFVNGLATGEVAKHIQKKTDERAKAKERREAHAELTKEQNKAQILRENEATREADRIRRGDPKPEEKPKTNT